MSFTFKIGLANFFGAKFTLLACIIICKNDIFFSNIQNGNFEDQFNFIKTITIE